MIIKYFRAEIPDGVTVIPTKSKLFTMEEIPQPLDIETIDKKRAQEIIYDIKRLVSMLDGVINGKD